MNKLIPKYRPVLTEDMMRECYGSLPEGDTKEYFRKFLLKIGAGLTVAGYVAQNKPTPNSAESLGFSETSTSTSTSYNRAKAEALYHKWMEDSLLVTESEFELVQTYRFENDLMSAEEEAEYTAKLIG